MDFLHLSRRTLPVFLNILHQTGDDILSAGILWYFLSSFLIMIFLCLLIVRVQSYCFTWSYSVTHTDSVGILWTSDRPVAETCTWQHTTLTTDRYSSSRWDSNPRSHHASSRWTAPYKARPPISVTLWYVVQIRNRNPSMPVAVVPRLTKRGHLYQLPCDTLSRHADSFRPTTLSPVPSFARSWLLSWCVTQSHAQTRVYYDQKTLQGNRWNMGKFLSQIIHKELH